MATRPCPSAQVRVTGESLDDYLANVAKLPGNGWTALGYLQVVNGLYSRQWTQYFPWPNAPAYYWTQNYFWSGFWPRNPGNLW